MRLLDIEIAEKVLGWKRYGAYVGGKRVVVLAASSLDCFRHGQTDRGNWDWTFDQLTTDEGVPEFSKDAELVEKLQSTK